MTTATFSFESFRSLSCVVLGGLAGALIGVPAAMATSYPFSAVLIVATTAFGVLTGYRRRRSIPFFYFSLFAVCVLALLISMAGLSQNQ